MKVMGWLRNRILRRISALHHARQPSGALLRIRRAKQRASRGKAVAAAQAALDNARREHDAKAEAIEAERAALDERVEAEQGRWDKQRKKLEEALRRART
ncbi:hypothetical protein ACVMGC_000540 [Bradyrhizobium barranii subsp. barranii]